MRTLDLKWMLGVLLAIVTSAYAESDDSSKVVDLGQMSVTGDVRKPSISWIDSQKSVREKVPGFVKSDFEEFEASLIESDQSKAVGDKGINPGSAK